MSDNLPPLMPCPFCGNEKNISMANEKHDHSGGYFIACPKCDASTGLRYAMGDDPRPLLVEQWNRRAAIEADRVSRDVPATQSVAIDYRQALELVEMFGGEPAEVRLIHGDGHSGPGLYAYYDELPEEGANFLGETDPDATPRPQQVEQAAQPVTHQFQARDGSWHGFIDERHMENTIKDGSWPIRALYTAPKAVPLTDEQIEAAAKVLSRCMDYPWEHMPESGRLNMRKNARTVIEAAIGTQTTVEKGDTP